jgi:hypothetical protein
MKVASTGSSVEEGALSGEIEMSNLIYIVGLVVVVIAVLSFFGLR